MTNSLYHLPTKYVTLENIALTINFIGTVEPLYIVATLGEQHFGRYTEVAFIQGWPLRGVPLYNYVCQWCSWNEAVTLNEDNFTLHLLPIITY